MNFLSLMSLQGRLNRKAFWWTAIVLGIVSLIGSGLMAYGITHHVQVLTAVGGLVYLLVLWPNITIAVRRNHDHDRSGWFLLLIFVGGTVGPNRFGPDPLGVAGMGMAGMGYAA